MPKQNDNAKKKKPLVVSKSNDLIQNAHYALNVTENKLLSYMLTKVDPFNDTADTVYEFNVREFSSIMKGNLTNTSYLKSVLKKLADKSWWITDMRGGDVHRETLFRWFSTVNLEEFKGNGKVGIRFHEKAVPFIMDLKRQKELNGIYYTSYLLDYVILMKNKYSARIYELLKSYQVNNREWSFEIGTGSDRDLFTKITHYDPDKKSYAIPDSWHDYQKFRRDVLEPAKNEINALSDIQIDYTPSHVDFSGVKHRRFVAISFSLCSKGDRTAEADRMQAVDAAIRMHEGAAAGAAALSSDGSGKPSYQELAGDFPELTSRQLTAIVKTALKKFPSGIDLSAEDRMSWAGDYISVYYDHVKATDDETRTSFYRRLSDSVGNDYKKVALRLAERYLPGRDDSRPVSGAEAKHGIERRRDLDEWLSRQVAGAMAAKDRGGKPAADEGAAGLQKKRDSLMEMIRIQEEAFGKETESGSLLALMREQLEEVEKEIEEGGRQGV